MVKNPPANAGYTGLIPDWEDLTCFGATKPVPQLLKPSYIEPMLSQQEKLSQGEAHAGQLERSPGYCN